MKIKFWPKAGEAYPACIQFITGHRSFVINFGHREWHREWHPLDYRWRRFGKLEFEWWSIS